MSKKISICFVVDTLVQHGAEKYLFEILKAIDKTRFECKVLCVCPLTELNSYYSPLIENLGVEVLEFEYKNLFNDEPNEFLRKIKNSFSYRFIDRFIKRDYVKNKADNDLKDPFKFRFSFST